MSRKFITTGYRKQLKRTIKFLLFLITIVLVFGCKEEKKTVSPEEEIIVAQVGNSTLTESQLKSVLSLSKNQNKFKDEIIAEWVEAEILYLQAGKNGILEDSLYKELIHSSSKKLAGSLFLRKYMNEILVDADEDSLFNYFNEHRDEFTLFEEAYNYRLIEIELSAFFDSTNALQWTDFSSGTRSVFPDSVSFVSKFETRSDITSERLLNTLDTLAVDEIVVIPNTEPGVVSIVQLAHKFEAGTVPDYSLVEQKVKERYYGYMRTVLYDRLIKDLYSEYNVLISR